MIEVHPEWRTAGVVRKLLGVVDEKNFSEPKVAADLAALAVEVAESIEPGLYPFDTIMKLRATAWRERAYATYYIGSFPESLVALEEADGRLSLCSVSEYEQARTVLVRALLYREIDRLDEASTLARRAKSVFRAYGDRRRAAMADSVEAMLLLRLRRFAEALPIELSLAGDSSLDQEMRANAFLDSGRCYKELGLLSQAKSAYLEAIRSYEALGLSARRAIARWGLARVFFVEGHYEPALTILQELRSEFGELGMAQDVALSALDVADVLLALGRPAEIADH
jgi:tetratricopeptide (TPR) repeat protein